MSLTFSGISLNLVRILLFNYMELPSILFFSISYLISSVCCCIGTVALFTSTDSDISDHPLPFSIAIIITHCISLSVFTSSTYAFLFRPALENQQPHTPIQYGLFQVGKTLISIVCAQILIISLPSFLPFFWIILSFLLFGYLYYLFTYKRPISPSIRMYLNHSYCWGLFSVVFAEVALLSFPWNVFIYLTYLLVPLSFSLTYIAFKDRFGRWGSSPFLKYVYQKRKIIEFAVGMVCSILFQYIFRATSLIEMVGFFCIAAAWLGSLAMVQPSTDVGIFNFLLVNACLNWAVNIFKVNGYTWLVFGACLFLFFLRWKLDSVSLRYSHIFAPIPTTAPSSSTMLTNISVSTNSNSPSSTHPHHPALPQSTNADPTPPTIASSLQFTLSDLRLPLAPQTSPAHPPARVHSF